MAKTMTIGPHPDFSRDLFEAQDIPTKDIEFKEDGSISLPNIKSKAYREVMSQILGCIQARGVEKTMVLPTNVDRIRSVIIELKAINNIKTVDIGLQDMINDLEMVANNLDPDKE